MVVCANYFPVKSAPIGSTIVCFQDDKGVANYEIRVTI